jgi:transposase
VEVVVAAVAAAALGGLWAAATRRHRRRRQARDADWQGAQARADVWTSQARCPRCGEVHGVLEGPDEELWFTCLACGHRHRRRQRG